jgi:Cu/Ag efflux protein CusF
MHVLHHPQSIQGLVGAERHGSVLEQCPMPIRSAHMPSAAMLLALALSGCAQPSPPVVATNPVGIDLGSAPGRALPAAPTLPAGATAPTSVADHRGHQPSASAGAAVGHGTIDAIDPDRRRITLTHEPMPKLGWPAMTMVFPVQPDIDLGAVHAGDHVDFSLMKSPDGSYRLRSIHPVHH